MLLAKHRQFIGVVAADPAEQLDPPLPLGAAGKRSRAHRSLTVHSHAAVSATRALVASGVAGSVGILLDLGRPDWAVISAVLVVHQGPDRIVGTVRGLHRLVGTVVGLALFAVAYQVGATGAALVLLLMVLMFLIDLMIARNYGVAVMFITPVALLIGGVGASGGPIAAPMRDRLIETLIGVVVALATLWLVVPRAHRHNLKWADARVLDSTAGLLHALRTENPNSDAALVLRRDLQLDLVIDDECGHRAVRDEVEWARLHWSRHTDTIRVGYDLLLQCWETPPGELIADPDGWATRIEKARLQ
nr:FUSC family protein [Antrihabitans stalactiti]